MAPTIQHPYIFSKKHSLVLHGAVHHHGHMTENRNPSRNQRFRTFMRYAWGDQVAANRALLKLTPYDDYLVNRRGR
jgi:hypothetical protein